MVPTQDEFSLAFRGEGDFVEFKEGVSASKTHDAVVAPFER